MSAVESARSAHTFLNATQKQALIAAVAAGMSQRDAAQHFKVHRNTVSQIMKSVKEYANPANPLSRDWKQSVLPKLQRTVERGLDYQGDPVGSANLAVKVMYGAGYLVSDSRMQVQGNVALTVSWLPMVEDTTRTIEATVSSVEPTLAQGLSESTSIDPT